MPKRLGGGQPTQVAPKSRYSQCEAHLSLSHTLTHKHTHARHAPPSIFWYAARSTLLRRVFGAPQVIPNRGRTKAPPFVTQTCSLPPAVLFLSRVDSNAVINSSSAHARGLLISFHAVVARQLSWAICKLCFVLSQLVACVASSIAVAHPIATSSRQGPSDT